MRLSENKDEHGPTEKRHAQQEQLIILGVSAARRERGRKMTQTQNKCANMNTKTSCTRVEGNVTTATTGLVRHAPKDERR